MSNLTPRNFCAKAQEDLKFMEDTLIRHGGYPVTLQALNDLQVTLASAKKFIIPNCDDLFNGQDPLLEDLDLRVPFSTVALEYEVKSIAKPYMENLNMASTKRIALIRSDSDGITLFSLWKDESSYAKSLAKGFGSPQRLVGLFLSSRSKNWRMLTLCTRPSFFQIFVW